MFFYPLSIKLPNTQGSLAIERNDFMLDFMIHDFVLDEKIHDGYISLKTSFVMW